MINKSFILKSFFLFIFSYGYIFCAEKQDIINCLSGTIYLNSKFDIADSIKARKYIELKKLTNVNSQEMIAFIEKYKNNPETWKKIEDSMQNTFKTKDTTHTIK